MVSKLFHFLASIYCALILIGLTALFVIAGTLLESHAESHLYAARLVYDQPYFSLLLWGFFINILFSSIKRWPFKVKHLPFLITHLGLLMILGGALVKHYFGFQGSLFLTEGSGSHLAFQPEAIALHLLKKGEQQPVQYHLKKLMQGQISTNGLKLQLLQFLPHAPQKLDGWIQGDTALIRGINHPLQIHLHRFGEKVPASGQLWRGDTLWQLFVLRTDHLAAALAELYQQQGQMRLTDRLSGQIILETSLQEALGNPLQVGQYGVVTTALKIEPSGKIWLASQFGPTLVTTDLQGPNRLINRTCSAAWFGDFPVAIDLRLPSILALIEDGKREKHLICIHPYGTMQHKLFQSEEIEALIVYDEGFGGYGWQSSFPLWQEQLGRKEREAAIGSQLVQQLEMAEAQGKELAPPLSLFKRACSRSGLPFAPTFTSFLQCWNATGRWSYPQGVVMPAELRKVFQNLTWNKPSLLQGADLALAFFEQIEPELLDGKELLTLLQEMRWPLLAQLEAEQLPSAAHQKTLALLTLIAQQIFAAAEQLSAAQALPLPHPLDPEHNAALFSLYLRAYQLHLHTLLPQEYSEEELSFLLEAQEPAKALPDLLLETRVFATHQEQPPKKKLEENVPAITLRLVQGRQADLVALAYDRTGKGLKWPALQSQYLLRLQPETAEIPYHIRLRSARRLNYPNSSKPMSFESDLLIADRRTGEVVEKTVSMNQVHETWEGYRFYLASISPQDEGQVKKIQLVVNHDPAKYWLTYPGALILSCGILLLFWLNPYRKK